MAVHDHHFWRYQNIRSEQKPLGCNFQKMLEQFRLGQYLISNWKLLQNHSTTFVNSSHKWFWMCIGLYRKFLYIFCKAKVWNCCVCVLIDANRQLAWYMYLFLRAPYLLLFWSTNFFTTNYLGINSLWGKKCAFFCTFLDSTVIFLGTFGLLRYSYCIATKFIHIVPEAMVVTSSESIFLNFHDMSSSSLGREYDFTKNSLSVKPGITFFFFNKSKTFITEPLIMASMMLP